MKNEIQRGFYYSLFNVSISEIYTNLSRDVAKEGETENGEIEKQRGARSLW
jgi:hypothetical protein